MSGEKHHNNDFFNNVISVYTQDQAIKDGILMEVGWLKNGRRVVFTRNLMESGEYENGLNRIQLIERGMQLLRKSNPEDTDYMKLRVIEKDKIWVIADGNGLTFMRPEDY